MWLLVIVWQYMLSSCYLSQSGIPNNTGPLHYKETALVYDGFINYGDLAYSYLGDARIIACTQYKFFD